jgi:hypothetical protein
MKIPTFTAKGRPTTEVGSIRSNIKIDPTKSMASALAPLGKAAEDYYIKQRDNNEKLAAKKKYYEMKSKSDEITKTLENNSDDEVSVNTYNEEFGNYRKQEVSKIKNKRVKQKLELLLESEQPENIYKIRSNSFKAFEAENLSMYNTEQNRLAAEYSLEEKPEIKALKKQQRIESAQEFSTMHNLGKPWLEKEIKTINTDSVIFDADKAIAGKNYSLALDIIKKADKSKVDAEEIQKKLLQVEKEGVEYRATSYGVNQILQGKNPTLGKTIPGTTDTKILEATDALLFNKAAANNLDPANTFRVVDDAFAPTGLVSPYYDELFEAGFNAGSITTFDTAADIPDVVIKAVTAAEAADKLGRLSVYTTEKEQEFFDNVIVAKEILGMNNYEAIKNAKEFQMNYDEAVMQGATKQKTKTFENLETFFKDKPWSLRDREITNIGEVKSYVDKIFNMYLAMNIDVKKAQKLTVNNIKKNLEVVDSYLYKKRDIDSFKSIGGLDMVKPVKTYIIKNNMIDEDPKDFYLRYNGGGIFEIRNRVDESQVYDKNSNPMIYYAKDLYAINQERESKFRSEIKKETQLKQEKKIKFKEEFKPLFGNSTGF